MRLDGGWWKLQGVQQLGNKADHKVSAQSQVNEPCWRTGLCHPRGGVCAAVVLDKENCADSDWLFLMYWPEFIGNL